MDFSYNLKNLILGLFQAIFTLKTAICSHLLKKSSMGNFTFRAIARTSQGYLSFWMQSIKEQTTFKITLALTQETQTQCSFQGQDVFW